jgi:hypothetical protein
LIGVVCVSRIGSQWTDSYYIVRWLLPYGIPLKPCRVGVGFS